MELHRIKFSKSWTCFFLALGVSVLSFSCSSDNKTETSNSANTTANTNTSAPAGVVSEKGVGPVDEVDPGAGIDQALAEKGQAIFEAKCSACHKFDQRYVGPALEGVTERRHPAWIMNMIMNPEEMTKKDPVAKKLLAEYMTQMVFQDVSRDETRAILEYFRQVDSRN